MHALDVLGEPVRRRIVELLADGEVAAGDIGRVVQAEFGISQPAVSQHLRVLREAGFASVRPDGTRRLYALDPAPIAAAAQWFTPFERFWRGPLDALGTELARGARARRHAAATTAPGSAPDASAHRDPTAPTTSEAPTRPTRPRTEPSGPMNSNATKPTGSSRPPTPEEH